MCSERSKNMTLRARSSFTRTGMSSILGKRGRYLCSSRIKSLDFVAQPPMLHIASAHGYRMQSRIWFSSRKWWLSQGFKVFPANMNGSSNDPRRRALSFIFSPRIRAGRLLAVYGFEQCTPQQLTFFWLARRYLSRVVEDMNNWVREDSNAKCLFYSSELNCFDLLRRVEFPSLPWWDF
jgi:hypothetical protein